MALRERDVIVAGLLEDPTVAASLLSNCLTAAEASSKEMTHLFSLNVPNTSSSSINGDREGGSNRVCHRFICI